MQWTTGYKKGLDSGLLWGQKWGLCGEKYGIKKFYCCGCF